MLLCLEGVDGTGKSSLAARMTQVLEQYGSVTMLHRGPLKNDPLDEYETALWEYRPLSGRHVICDRWHWGEDVYGPLYRGESKLTPPVFAHIEKTLQARGALMVLMTNTLETLQRRWAERGEDFLKPEDAVEALELYYQIASRSSVLTMQVSDPDDDELVLLLKTGAVMEEQAAVVNDFTTYVGPTPPLYLLLGERRGPKNAAGQTGAFAPYGGTSGKYLLEALPPDVRDYCGIANALEEDSFKLWEALGRPRVVTLGVEAHTACQVAGVPHGSVPHPQWVRRFAHSHQTAYGRVIRDALLHGRNMVTWRP